uniref:INO80 complex subunit B n=1 Tax=Magallana gigas TaxID=29159 RepID=K1Q5I2_MAGGI|eukprot:XP_011418138.1 PREDICTED: INO80 complex subunit B [Crassostrea gigas]
MGKRKESGTEEDIFSDSSAISHKKHKKHKKKHKKKKDQGEDYAVVPEGGGVSGGVSGVGGPKIKLKLKIGGQTMGTKNLPSVEKTENSGDDSPVIDVTDETWEGEEPSFPTKKKGDDTSDEEKEWLDALEKGTLDDSGMLKRSKDPKLMTARQRALIHGQQAELLQLPSGYKTVELTEEQVEKRQQRAKKRRQQAQEKREKDKKQTLDRLLKKQEAKSKGPKMKGSRRSNVPRVRYINNKSEISISVPTGIQFPFPPQRATPPKQAISCGVGGCTNQKKYSCSKTGTPLCSLDCYKKNLLQNAAQIPIPAT